MAIWFAYPTRVPARYTHGNHVHILPALGKWLSPPILWLQFPHLSGHLTSLRATRSCSCPGITLQFRKLSLEGGFYPQMRGWRVRIAESFEGAIWAFGTARCWGFRIQIGGRCPCSYPWRPILGYPVFAYTTLFSPDS